MTDNTMQRASFLVLLLLISAAFLWLIRSFLQPIFWAAVLTIAFYPIHGRFERRLRGRRSLAAVASVLSVVLIVIVPLAGLGTSVSAEAVALYERLAAGEIDMNRVYHAVEQRIPQLIASLEALGVDLGQLQAQISSSAVTISQYIASRALEVGQNTLRIAVMFFLMIYLLYFFLRDGPRVLDGLVHALPLSDERERRLLGRFAEVSRATLKGTLVVSAVQGAIGGVAFWLLGFSAPVLWGVLMGLLSLLPAVGAALVWLPAAILLFATGRPIGGLALLAVGVLVIGLVDNLLRPLLVGRDTRMPDYLILLATLGGLAGFGVSGIVIGPIIAALFLSIWEMAAEEFSGKTDLAAVIDTLPGNSDRTG